MNYADDQDRVQAIERPLADAEPAFRAAVVFQADGTAQVAVDGEVDYLTAQRLDEALRWAAERSVGEIVVDFRGLTFAGAACVNVLVAAQDRLGRERRRLRLEQVPFRLSRLFALCGTYFLVTAPERQPRSHSSR